MPPTELLTTAQTLINAQAEDEALWLPAKTAVEDYLQRALRELHAAVERDSVHQSAIAWAVVDDDGDAVALCRTEAHARERLGIATGRLRSRLVTDEEYERWRVVPLTAREDAVLHRALLRGSRVVSEGAGVAPSSPEYNPEAAWHAYAIRTGLLNDHGISPAPARTQDAYNGYTAGWNDASAAWLARERSMKTTDEQGAP